MSAEVDRATARALAEAHIRRPNPYPRPGSPLPEELAIRDELTEEHSCGWVFFYDWRPDLPQRRDPHQALAGNAPILVTRTGEVHVTGTAHPVEWYLANFERTGKVAGGRTTDARLKPAWVLVSVSADRDELVLLAEERLRELGANWSDVDASDTRLDVIRMIDGTDTYRLWVAVAALPEGGS